jgi:hypothetical protein
MLSRGRRSLPIASPDHKEDRMPALENDLTVTEAAQELGLTPWGLRTAIQEGRIKPVRLDKTSRTNLIHHDKGRGTLVHVPDCAICGIAPS